MTLDGLAAISAACAGLGPSVRYVTWSPSMYGLAPLVTLQVVSDEGVRQAARQLGGAPGRHSFEGDDWLQVEADAGTIRVRVTGPHRPRATATERAA